MGASRVALPAAGTLLVVEAPVAQPDAIVSLASHEWERLPKTAALARDNPAARVLLTLPGQVSVYNCHDCGRRVERLVRAGVARERIEMLRLTDGGTRGEALAVLGEVKRLRLRRVVVVTSPYHTRRALAVFRKVLADADVQVGCATAPDPEVGVRPGQWWRTPADRAYVGYEWAGLVYYWLRFGVPMSR